MKTVKENTVTTFSAIEFKDALNVLPLMNTLVQAINEAKLEEFYRNLDKEERNEYWSPNAKIELCMNGKELENAYNALRELGFESTIDFVEPSVEQLRKKG